MNHFDNISTSPSPDITRRSFLKGKLLLLTALAVPLPAWGALSPAIPERSLSFYNPHTGEDLRNVIYWADGGYVDESLEDISYLLRDFRNNETKPIDPALLDQLFAIRRQLQIRKPVHVISGYRSPATNDMLRQKSSGVARRSLHMDARAADIRIPGVELPTLRRAALSLRRGGVGYYPRSNFIHIDTGAVRSW